MRQFFFPNNERHFCSRIGLTVICIIFKEMICHGGWIGHGSATEQERRNMCNEDDGGHYQNDAAIKRIKQRSSLETRQQANWYCYTLLVVLYILSLFFLLRRGAWSRKLVLEWILNNNHSSSSSTTKRTTDSRRGRGVGTNFRVVAVVGGKNKKNINLCYHEVVLLR